MTDAGRPLSTAPHVNPPSVVPPPDPAGVADGTNWLERHKRALANCSQRTHDFRFGPVFVRGAGARLWDTNGHPYWDLTCGYSANNFGHAYPPLVNAAQRAVSELGHVTGDPHTSKILLAEQLLERCGFCPSAGSAEPCDSPAPPLLSSPRWAEPPRAGLRPGKVIFNTSGGRAIETAWKGAVSFRPGKILVLAPAFHGRTIATSELSDTTRTDLQLRAGSHLVQPNWHFPYCARCPEQARIAPRFPDCGLLCSEALFEQLDSRADDISAVLVEPALGARGYIFPPAEFFQRVRELTSQRGILLIADEVQTGLGRCGSWLLCEQQGWQPDLIVMGKSLAGGMSALSAVVGRAEVLDAIPPGAESETFAASPFACAVACRVLELLADGQLYRRAQAIGESLRSWFAAHPQRSQWGIQRIEGVGASCVLEFANRPLRSTPSLTQLSAPPLLAVSPNATTPDSPPTPVSPPTPASPIAAAAQLAKKMFAQGLLVHHTGPEATRIVLLPPLTLTDAELGDIFGCLAMC